MNVASKWDRRISDWHPQQIETKNLEFLDGLRGVAILLVVVLHVVYFNPSSGRLTQFVNGLLLAGNYGVILFFSLSGFLVSLPFWKRKLAGKTPLVPPGYAKRRFFKIYPPLLLSLVVFTPTYVYYQGSAENLKASLQWLIGWPLFFPVTGTVNEVMWSLIPEVSFYATIPFVMLLFHKIPMDRCIWMIPLFFVAIALASRLVFARFGITDSFSTVIRIPFLSKSDVFAMGVWVAGLYARGFASKSYAKLGIIGLVIAAILLPVTGFVFCVGNYTQFFRDWAGFVMKIASGLMLFLAANEKSLAARALCLPLLRWCGIVSYEWYLCHRVVVMAVRELIGPANGNVAIYLFIVVGSFLMSLLLAALVYKYFSLPILLYGRSSQKVAAR
jgi:peptidoglycan/LPS O-acetylase OafA/YrhL